MSDNEALIVTACCIWTAIWIYPIARTLFNILDELRKPR